MGLNWRNITDWAKKEPAALRLADRLGRGRGSIRILDHLRQPPSIPRPSLHNWDRHQLAAVWVGHATVLLKIGDATLLTDPVFSNRVGIGLGLITGGPRRLVAPALSISDLPPLDAILVSHAHFDHLDRPTLNRLDKNIPVITSHHTSDLICDLGFRHVSELRWGESLHVRSIRLTARRVQHWGAHTFHDQHRGFNAFLIESTHRRILFGGDTAYCDYFQDIGHVDLAILGIGGYDPYVRAHATPEQAWDMAQQVRATHVLPMHHSTFRLSREPVSEPVERLRTVAGNSADRLIMHNVGGAWSI